MERRYRQVQRFGETHRRLVAAFFGEVAVSLQFDVDVLFSEENRQHFQILAGFFITVVEQRSRQHTFLATRETHQPLRVFPDLVERGRSRSFFFLAQFVARDEAAEILITLPAFDEKSQPDGSRRRRIR